MKKKNEAATVALHAQLKKLRDFVGRDDWPYRSPFDFVLREGENFEPAELTAEEQKLVAKALKGRRFRRQECFMNARSLLLGATHSPFDYVEGYVLSSGLPLPIHHGWLAIGKKVIDVTVMNLGDQRISRVLGTFPETRAYIGARFASEYVRNINVRTGTLRAVIDDWESEWPLLRGLDTNWRPTAA